jgi:hypothetical protein
VNLSSVLLSESDISLLNKGLLFVPKPKKLPMEEILIAKNKICRNLKLKAFFDDRTKKTLNAKNSTTIYDPKQKKFQFSSTWEPPFNLLNEDVKGTISKINSATNDLLKQLPGDVDGSLILPGDSNLTEDERKSLKRLQNDKTVVIKKSDKSNAVVVLDRESYVNEAVRQLYNTKYYEKLPEPVFRRNVDKINSIVGSLQRNGYISKKQLDYLLADAEEARNRIFYLLPKIHKKADTWPQPGRMPEGRPIVSDCSSESYRISEYIDSYLAPLANKHETYIKNTYDFVEKIRNKIVSKDCLLVTADVTSLYTNMNLDRVLNVVREAFNRHPDESRPSNELLQLLEIILKNNDFEFNGEYFLQILGVAMGKRFAPALANLYLIAFDELAKHGFKITPEALYRFLDDLFWIWNGTREELIEFENFLNSLIPDIKVTLTCHDTHINFLDTVIYKLTVGNETMLKTRVYFKPTDTHQLLHTHSFHPKHTTEGILKSQLIRFKRISSSLYDYEAACHTLFSALQSRGYSKSLLRKMKRDVWHPKSETRQIAANVEINNTARQQFIPLVLRYSQVSHKFVNLWKGIIQENQNFVDYRLIAAYKKNVNIQNILVKSKLQPINSANAENSIDEVSTAASDVSANRGFYLCNASRCLTCRWHAVKTETFYSDTYKSTFQIRDSINCRTSNIIYLITCKKCKLQYVGETGRCLGDRLTDHRSNIKLKKDTPIANHFNLPEHVFTDLIAVAIETVPHRTNALLLRRQREKFWQLKIGTTFPTGLNNNPAFCVSR